MSSKLSSSLSDDEGFGQDSLEEVETPKLRPIKKTSKKRLFQIQEAASSEEMTPNVDYGDKFAQKEVLLRGMESPMYLESVPSVEEGKRGVENTFPERYNFKQIVHSKPNFLSNDSPSKEQNNSNSKSRYSLGRIPREEDKSDEGNKVENSPLKQREEKHKSRLLDRRLRRATIKRALKENLEGAKGINSQSNPNLEAARRLSENKLQIKRYICERKNSKIQDSQASISIQSPEISGNLSNVNLDDAKLTKSPYNYYWSNQGSEEGSPQFNSSLFFPAKQSTPTIISNLENDARLAELHNNLNLLIKASSLQFKKICHMVGKLNLMEKRASKHYSGRRKEHGVSIQW